MFVKPAAGMLVPDPVLSDYLPAEGREVQDSPYWRRRERDGDVTVGDPPATTAADAAEEA